MLCLFPKILAADLQSFRNMIDTSEVIYADIFSKTVEGYKVQPTFYFTTDFQVQSR